MASSGVLVIDKPRGPTSHDVVARVRRALGERAVGHAGTLDPMATGVLVVAVGEATKLVPWLTAAHKCYEATVALGVETDSLDAEGRETRRADVPPATLEALAASRGPSVAHALRDALAAERARTTQVPPAFSAIQQGGERAYSKARRGEAVDLAPRGVQVHALDLLACGDDHPPWLVVRVEVSKGYYVRALARDLAAALGTVGHLTALRRTRSGCFTLDEALPLETPPDELAARVDPLERVAARALPVARLSHAGARDASHGRAVRPEDLDAPASGPCAWLDPEGRLLAVGETDSEGRGRVLRGFARSEAANPAK